MTIGFKIVVIKEKEEEMVQNKQRYVKIARVVYSNIRKTTIFGVVLSHVRFPYPDELQGDRDIDRNVVSRKRDFAR